MTNAEHNGSLTYKGRTIRVERIAANGWQLREGNERLAILPTKVEAICHGKKILTQS